MKILYQGGIGLLTVLAGGIIYKASGKIPIGYLLTIAVGGSVFIWIRK